MDELYTIEELLQEKFTHRWVMQRLLPSGAGMLFHGKRGVGKSLLLQALALSILREGRLFGRWQTKRRGSVLYVQADLPPVMQQDRVRRLAKHFPWITNEDLYFYCPSYLDVLHLDEDEELLGRLQETEPCIVIWDVLRKIHHLREEVHVPAIVYGETRFLFPEAAHFYTHHDRKTTRDRAEGYLDPAEDFSGVGPWLDLVVSAWHLEEDLPGHYTLETTKNNCGPMGDKVLLHRDPKTLLPVCRRPSLQEEIDRWRRRNDANPRRLSPAERRRLKEYLFVSGLALSSTVRQIMEGVV